MGRVIYMSFPSENTLCPVNFYDRVVASTFLPKKKKKKKKKIDFILPEIKCGFIYS